MDVTRKDIDSLKVAVVCDYPILRESIAQVLAATDRFCVSCLTFTDEVDSKPEYQDVVLCVFGAWLGIASVLERVKEALPEAKLACLILSDDDRAVLVALKGGATGIIDTSLSVSSGKDEFAERIERIAAGEFVLPTPLANRLARRHVQETTRQDASRAVALTRREQEVLELLSDGLTNRDIARRLYVSEHTVRAHLRVVMQKLQVTNRVQAAALLWKENLATDSNLEEINGYSHR